MPTRLAVRVPRTFVDRTGREQRRYTDAGTAVAADDADRVDIVLHPGVAATTAIVVMPRDDGGAAAELPAHVRAERYDVVTSWRCGDGDGTAVRHAALGVLFRNRAGTGFNLRVNDNVAVTGRLAAFPADGEREARHAGAEVPAGRFDDDVAALDGEGPPAPADARH